MKYISLILSVYILALALLPCADQIDWCISDKGSDQAIELAETGAHDHSGDSKDLCSPLCTCSCCHINLRTPLKSGFSLTPPKPIVNPSPSSFPLLVDLKLLNDIWQPPRLS